jgi:hypothetical protein
MSARTDEITEVEMPEDVELLVAEDIFLRVSLDASTLIAHVNKHAFAHFTVRGDATGHGHFTAFGVMVARLLAGFAGCEFVFERVNALGAQRSQLGLALFDQ